MPSSSALATTASSAPELARSGLSVGVFDPRNILGGAAVPEEFHPRFCNSTAGYTVSLLHPKVIRDLRLPNTARRFSSGTHSMDRHFRKLGASMQRDIHEPFMRSAGDLLDHGFASDGVKTLYGFDAVADNYASPAHRAAHMCCCSSQTIGGIRSAGRTPRPHRAGSATFRMNVALSLEHMDHAYAKARLEGSSRRPIVELLRPTIRSPSGCACRLVVLSAFLLQFAGRSRLASGKTACNRPHLRDSQFARAKLPRACRRSFGTEAARSRRKNPV